MNKKINEDTRIRDQESKLQITQSLKQGYEAGIRDLVEDFIGDLAKGLEALDGDIKATPPDKIEYYRGYQRALRISIERIRELSMAMGVYLVSDNHL